MKRCAVFGDPREVRCVAASDATKQGEALGKRRSARLHSVSTRMRSRMCVLSGSLARGRTVACEVDLCYTSLGHRSIIRPANSVDSLVVDVQSVGNFQLRSIATIPFKLTPNIPSPAFHLAHIRSCSRTPCPRQACSLAGTEGSWSTLNTPDRTRRWQSLSRSRLPVCW